METKGMDKKMKEAELLAMFDGIKAELAELCAQTAMNPLFDDKYLGVETALDKYGALGDLIHFLGEGAFNYRVKIEFLGEMPESARATQKVASMVLLRELLKGFTSILGSFAAAHQLATGENLDELFARFDLKHAEAPTQTEQ